MKMPEARETRPGSRPAPAEACHAAWECVPVLPSPFIAEKILAQVALKGPSPVMQT